MSEQRTITTISALSDHSEIAEREVHGLRRQTDGQPTRRHTLDLPVKIAALFAALETKDLDELSPVERRKFGELLRHWAELAERGRRVQPQVGVLRYLRGHD